jgi:sugar lactone lactonase YvrE
MEFEPITKGFYLEALSIGDDGDIWFSDVIPGGVRRLSRNGRVDEWLSGRCWIGCIALNEDGCVLSSGPRGIAWVNPSSGASGMLLESINGKPLKGVNEMLPDRNGGLIFGTLDVPAIERGAAPEPVGLYRLDTDGRVTQLWDQLKFSNGIVVSQDGRKLFHNETFVGTSIYDIASDGSLRNPRLVLEKPDCDGMALDSAGRIWVAGYRSSEIICLTPEGAVDSRVPLAAEGLTNLRFGGADARDLYLTTVPPNAGDGLAEGKIPTEQNSVLFRTRTSIAGQPIGRTRFRLK